jgi:hypothetical protein
MPKGFKNPLKMYLESHFRKKKGKSLFPPSIRPVGPSPLQGPLAILLLFPAEAQPTIPFPLALIPHSYMGRPITDR